MKYDVLIYNWFLPGKFKLNSRSPAHIINPVLEQGMLQMLRIVVTKHKGESGDMKWPLHQDKAVNMKTLYLC